MHPDAEDVKSAIAARYPGLGADAETSTDALVATLATLTPAGATPLDSIAATEGASPDQHQAAVLAWLDQGFTLWRERYPLDEGLSLRFEALAPIIAAQALSDNTFLALGTHPLHRLLDALHDAAVGWESNLGRAGEALEQDLEELTARCNSWFEDRSVSFAEIAADQEIRLKRAATRAERMNQRLAEKEQGRVQISACRRKAAAMINRHLESPLPITINDFLTGHWFDSAQLVILKHGADSDEWLTMQAATERLLESTRSNTEEDSEDENRRQHLFQLVSQLPRELKRWLYSLQHDKEAIDDTLGLVEYVHLRLLRNEELELEKAEPIAVEDEPDRDAKAPRPDVALDDWYQLATSEGVIRGRLVLDLPGEYSLVFANYAGALATTLSYGDFTRMTDQGLVTALETGTTFTRSLIAALDESGATTAAPDGDSNIPSADSEPPPEPEPDQATPLVVEAETVNEAEASTQDDEGSATIMPFPEPDRTVDPQALPIGSWLGFHDGEVPLMARLAVHDPEQDSYIFVDRKGVKLREIVGRDLQKLFDEDSVDLLELRAPPRTEIKPASDDDQEETA